MSRTPRWPSGARCCSRPPSCERALRGPIFLNRGPLPGLQDESRLLAVPVSARGQKRVVVVGTSTEARSESLTDLLQLLLVGGPVALHPRLARRLRRRRRRAAPGRGDAVAGGEISAAEPDRRLPVPPTHDEVARLGTTLNEMLERLGEALEHERAFVADASHELRTPLAILRTELELALAEGRSREELRAALASAAEETDRLTQLSEDLLTIAQTERGELPLRLARLSLAETFDGVSRRFARRAEDGGREIEASAPSSLALDADRLRLDQAIGNMVDNALRYGAGPIELEARVGGRVGRDPRPGPRRGVLRGVPRAGVRALQPRVRRAAATAAAASAWRSCGPSLALTEARRTPPIAPAAAPTSG